MSKKVDAAVATIMASPPEFHPSNGWMNEILTVSVVEERPKLEVCTDRCRLYKTRLPKILRKERNQACPKNPNEVRAEAAC